MSEILQWLEEQGHEYLVKVKLKRLTDLLDAQEWSSIESQSGWAQSSFKYKCKKWNEPRAFVAVRQKAKEQDENLLGLVKYDYFCDVTSDNRSPWGIHKKYGERATCEAWIEEEKNQMALVHIVRMCLIRTAESYLQVLESFKKVIPTTTFIPKPGMNG